MEVHLNRTELTERGRRDSGCGYRDIVLLNF